MSWRAGIAAALAAAALAGCTQDNFGSVGAEGSAASAASIDTDRLCDWSHRTHYGGGYHIDPSYGQVATYCRSSRQVYTTCNIRVFGPHGEQNDRTHGSQRCSVRQNYLDLESAWGSQATFWLRLDNPDRRWRSGFRGGDPISCSISENAESQSILRCDHYHWGSDAPIGRILQRSFRDAIGEAPTFSPAARSKLTRACAAEFRTGKNPEPGSDCARAARRALRQLPANVRSQILRGLQAEGIKLRGKR